MASSRLVAKIESEETTLRLAVLIDADNAQPSVIEGLLGEIAKFGEATVKRIYGDFTSQSSSSWKKVLLKYAIKPIQQFAYTTGKNATDSTLIIDAMDLLYTGKFDGFCLVSSDSDFTGLAVRLREEGIRVFGFGEQKTPEAFRSSCHKFLFTEVLRPNIPTVKLVELSPQNEVEQKINTEQSLNLELSPNHDLPKELFLKAIEQSSGEDGWANLGTFGSYLTKVKPDFDPRHYGYKKLSELVKEERDLFITEERLAPGSNLKNLYIKPKINKKLSKIQNSLKQL